MMSVIMNQTSFFTKEVLRKKPSKEKTLKYERFIKYKRTEKNKRGKLLGNLLKQLLLYE